MPGWLKKTGTESTRRSTESCVLDTGIRLAGKERMKRSKQTSNLVVRSYYRVLLAIRYFCSTAHVCVCLAHWQCEVLSMHKQPLDAYKYTCIYLYICIRPPFLLWCTHTRTVNPFIDLVTKSITGVYRSVHVHFFATRIDLLRSSWAVEQEAMLKGIDHLSVSALWVSIFLLSFLLPPALLFWASTVTSHNDPFHHFSLRSKDASHGFASCSRCWR